MVENGGVFIGLGSNLGDREAHIRDALRQLQEPGDIRVLACSRLYETEPEGGPPGQPLFLNAVAELATSLDPHQLLERLLEIERRHGRRRDFRNGSRTLDLDLLLYRDRAIDCPDLRVPHPRMWQRAFVMRPLAEICDPVRLAAARELATIGAGSGDTVPVAGSLNGQDSGRALGGALTCSTKDPARARS